jgi:hypothetical protein
MASVNTTMTHGYHEKRDPSDCPKVKKGPANFAIELVSLLFRIREVRGSNLGSETDYPDRHFAVFPNPFRQTPGQ